METEFFLAMNPPTVTHQEHKITVVKGKPIFYDPPELKAARQKLMVCRTCIYRERNGGTSGKCNYLTMTGHSRNMGQPEEKCSKYVKGKRGRKSGKRKV